MKLFKKFGFIFIVGMLFWSCQSNEDNTPDEVIVDDGDSSDSLPIGEVGACFEDEYASQPNNVDQLDILIVSYNSINLRPQRERLADNLESLFAQIPSGVDYRVGVVQGVGSHSDLSGKLYQRYSEPLVLRSDQYQPSEIKNYVKQKLNPPTVDVVLESIFGPGSMGLYSAYRALGENSQGLKDEGLLREGASLLVLFVSDQSDVCAEYPEGVSTFNKRAREQSFMPRAQGYQRDCFIENDQGESELLDVEKVHAQFKAAASGPLNVAGVFYNNPITVPRAAWKEFGYGYNDIVKKAAGISHDLASSDYDEAMTKIGMVSSASVVNDDKFNLQTSDVLVSTIEIEVDGMSVDFSFIPELNQVHLTELRSSLSSVKVSYCEKKIEEKQNIMVATGANHTCGLLSDGSVRCWGLNNFGQLGLGHTDTIGDDEPLFSVEPLVFEENVVEIAAGGFHTCALFESGDVTCWGRNNFGQLGFGDTLNRGDVEKASALPKLSLGGKVEQIYAGTTLTCALMRDENIVKCWGDNRLGQLGLGDTQNRGDDELPSDYTGIEFNEEVRQLDLSTVSNHICALFEEGKQRCWGFNRDGQLGLGDSENRGDDELASSIDFVSVDNDAGPIFVTTGSFYTCALLDTQDVKCWGRNVGQSLGLYGVDFIGQNDLPSDYPALDFGAAVSHIANGNTTTCAVSTSNQVKCWGTSEYGQMGYAYEGDLLSEGESLSDLPFLDLGDYKVLKVAMGANHSCALTSDTGEILCWGDNRYGQLGYGDTLSTSDTGAPSPLERGAISYEPPEPIN